MIKRSSETGSYILVASRVTAANTFRQAESMGLKIPYPITLQECLSDRFSMKNKQILIDEFPLVLSTIFNPEQVSAVSLTKPENLNVIYLENHSSDLLNAVDAIGTLFVAGDTCTAFFRKTPGYLIDKLNGVMSEIRNWQIENNESLSDSDGK